METINISLFYIIYNLNVFIVVYNFKKVEAISLFSIIEYKTCALNIIKGIIIIHVIRY